MTFKKARISFVLFLSFNFYASSYGRAPVQNLHHKIQDHYIEVGILLLIISHIYITPEKTTSFLFFICLLIPFISFAPPLTILPLWQPAVCSLFIRDCLFFYLFICFAF